MKGHSLYRIFVFLSEPISGKAVAGLVAALRGAHFETLCQQYRLDPGGIEGVLAHLEVVGNPASAKQPFFMVKYGLKQGQTLVIDVWEVAKPDGKALLEAVKAVLGDNPVQKSLDHTEKILGIDLSESQLQDMGLLLAYEVARWAGFHGNGVIRGLDGGWYTLNQHQAFLPIS